MPLPSSFPPSAQDAGREYRRHGEDRLRRRVRAGAVLPAQSDQLLAPRPAREAAARGAGLADALEPESLAAGDASRRGRRLADQPARLAGAGLHDPGLPARALRALPRSAAAGRARRDAARLPVGAGRAVRRRHSLSRAVGLRQRAARGCRARRPGRPPAGGRKRPSDRARRPAADAARPAHVRVSGDAADRVDPRAAAAGADAARGLDERRREPLGRRGCRCSASGRSLASSIAATCRVRRGRCSATAAVFSAWVLVSAATNGTSAFVSGGEADRGRRARSLRGLRARPRRPGLGARARAARDEPGGGRLGGQGLHHQRRASAARSSARTISPPSGR